MQPAEIEARLSEWSRWARSCQRPRGRAGSAEGFYRSPQHWEPLTHAPPPAPIAHRAWQVECIVVALHDPYRIVIVLHYVHQQPDVVLRRSLRRRGFKSIGIVEAIAVLAEARRMVAVALDGGVRARSQVPGYPVLSATV